MMKRTPKTTTGRKVERFFWIVVLAGILLLLFASCVDLKGMIEATVKTTVAAISEETTTAATVQGDNNTTEVVSYSYDRAVYWLLAISAAVGLILPRVRRFVIAMGGGAARKVKTFLGTQEPTA